MFVVVEKIPSWPRTMHVEKFVLYALKKINVFILYNKNVMYCFKKPVKC